MSVSSPKGGSATFWSSNRLSGGVAILLGVALIWARPTAAEPSFNGDPGAAFFPLVVSGMVIVLGLFLALTGNSSARPPMEASASTSSPRLLVGSIFVAATVVYAVIFPTVGFTVSTFGYLLVSALTLGKRTPRAAAWAVAFAVVGAVASGEILTRGFGAFLPGILTL